MSTLTLFREPFLSRSNRGGFFDSIFDDIFDLPQRTTRSNQSFPTTKVDELDDRYEISVIAPGLTKEDIAIALDDRNLTVSFESDTEDGRTIGYSSFKRAWTVPEGTTEKDIEAEYTSGILSIGVQKHTPKKIPTKTITIK